MTVKFPTSKVTDAFETCKKIEFYTLKWINNKCFKVNYNIIILLIILPIILDIFFIKLYGVNVPYMDQWVFVPLIDKFYNSNLDLNDLFAQHNEHRLPFARIIMLISMYFTHYNNVAEMYISCSIASLTLFMLFLLYKQQFGLSRSSLIGFIPVSWLLFDFRQYDNILLGFTIHIYLAIFGLIVSIYSLKNTRKIDRMFVLAILGGVLSSFSFLTGLLIWPLGLLLIVVSSKTDKISLGASWSFAGIVTLCIYFYNWVKPAQTPNLLYSLKNPLDSIAYMFIYIGSFYGIEIHKDIIQIHGAVTSGSLMSFIFVHISAVLGVLIVFATIISNNPLALSDAFLMAIILAECSEVLAERMNW